jgi:hypothetical protein
LRAVLGHSSFHASHPAIFLNSSIVTNTSDFARCAFGCSILSILQAFSSEMFLSVLLNALKIRIAQVAWITGIGKP